MLGLINDVTARFFFSPLLYNGVFLEIDFGIQEQHTRQCRVEGLSYTNVLHSGRFLRSSRRFGQHYTKVKKMTGRLATIHGQC